MIVDKFLKMYTIQYSPLRSVWMCYIFIKKGINVDDDKRVRVGIIGYGMMGKMHQQVWSAIPEAKVVAITDIAEAQRSEAEEFGLAMVYDDAEKMFTHHILDIVVVATHARLHAKHVRSALLHGCHVICEKPMGLSLLQCDAMIAEARRRNLKLAINHQSIFSRAVMVVEQKIKAGDIGDLYAIKAYGKGRIACSDLMEIAGHLLHLMWHFAEGVVTEIFGDVTYKGRPVTIDDAVRVQDLYPEGRDSGIGAGDRMFGYYKFSNGIRGELHLDALSGAPDTFTEKLGDSRKYGYYIELCGTVGRMQLYLPRVLFFNSSPYDDLSKSATPWTEVNPDLRKDVDPVLIAALNCDFLAAIAQDRNPMVSGDIGRTVMEMTLGIYASHLAGRPLALPLANRAHPFRQCICATCNFPIDKSDLYCVDKDGRLHHADHTVDLLARALNKGAVIGGFPDDLDEHDVETPKE